MSSSPRYDRRRQASSSTAAPRGHLETKTLRIDGLAAGGDGIARLADGLVVFVPHAAPGELVEAAIDRRRKPAQGRILRVIEPGADRVEPACPYVASCGGCDWMHLGAGAQERGHAAIVTSAIARAAPAAALPEVVIHAAPAALAYRTRARLLAKAERGRVQIGYRAAGSHELALVDACAVLHPALAPLLAALAPVLAGASGSGDVLIARGHGGLPVVEIAWRGELAPATWAAFDARVREGAWAGARVLLDGVSLPATFGDPRPWMLGADGEPLFLAAGGFAQPSDEGAAALARRVDELARMTGTLPGFDPLWKEPKPRHVVELFAGSGTLSVLLARGTASFTAVEIDPDAAAAARQNLDARGLSSKGGAKIVTDDADAFPLPPKTELVVLDPPRSGAPGAARAIAASSARAVIYVACDPPTLARDLAVLTAAGFVLTHLETFELFPQTSHVETVARLVRVRPAREGGPRGARALP